jgi:hypothetical protein
MPIDQIPHHWCEPVLEGKWGGTLHSWYGNKHAIQVAFDENGLVIGCYLLEVHGLLLEERPGLIRHFLDWLGV